VRLWTYAAACGGALLTAGCGGGDGSTAPIGAQAAQPADLQSACAALAANVPSATAYTSVQAVTGGTFTPTGGTAITGLPDFCRVAATLTPTSDSNIQVEVWMPLKGWNGKFLGTGNGGLAGAIQYEPLSDGLKRGYAVANTDMGTSPSPDALVGVPNKWIDFGYRSTHLMTVLGKQLVASLYGKAPSYSYFHGCSTGGGQGFHEAQQYPTDYNGIVAGDPGNFRTGVHTDILWNYVASRGTGNLSSADLTVLKNAAVAKCDAADGVTDGIISRPDLCTFDPSVLLCTGSNTTNCLSADQVTAAKKIYAGVKYASTGQQYHDGLPPGSERGGWNFGIAPPNAPMLFPQIFQTVFGSSWTPGNFNWNSDLTTMDTALGPMVNATSPDLRAFEAAGGKIIHFQGLADGVQPYTMSRKYWDSVEKFMPGEQGKFARLFEAPGMVHCSGGDGPNVFGNTLSDPYAGDPTKDLLSALEAWIEKGIPADTMIGTKFANNDPKQAVQMTRPLCAYPKVLKYTSGDTNHASSFACALP
jgi:feruloyl esterase